MIKKYIRKKIENIFQQNNRLLESDIKKLLESDIKKLLESDIKKLLESDIKKLLESDINEIINLDIKRLIKASIINKETFSPLRNFCKGKKLVICGCGPSLSKYKPIKDAVHIALNRAFLKKDIHFDFIFSCDHKGIKKYQKEIIEYNNCIKLFGDYSNIVIHDSQHPSEFVEKTNTKKFFLTMMKGVTKDDIDNYNFIKDIDLEPLCDFPNVGLIVLQFALFMNPTDIYLVGYDMGSEHFTDLNYSRKELESHDTMCNSFSNLTRELVMECWKKFIKFKNYHYSSVRMHSINPVGLKGLFDDIYEE